MIQRSTYPILAFLIIFLCGSFSISGQNISTVQGNVSQADGTPIGGVSVSIEGTRSGTTTNRSGEFELTVDLRADVQLVFGHVSFRDTIVAVTKELLETTGNRLMVVMTPEVYTLNPAEVKRPKPEVVFGHAEMHVADLEFVPQGLLLLTYGSEIRAKQHFRSADVIYRHPKLVLTDRDQNILDTEYLVGEVSELYRDHLDRVFVIGRMEVQLVNVKDDELELQSVPVHQFMSEIQPCVDTLGENIYFSTYDATFPAFSYFSFDQQDSTFFEVCSIEDEPLMDLFRSQYKYMSGRDKVRAMDVGFNTGVDPEVVAAYMTGFHNDLYYEPLYAPLFVQDETVLVFDHYRNVLKKYGPCHEDIGEIELKHHKRKPMRNWRKLLLHDEAKGVIYTVHEKAGKLQLFPIDLETGELGQPFELYYKWAENLNVDNGEVYYIYRPFGSPQKKFLYMETIR